MRARRLRVPRQPDPCHGRAHGDEQRRFDRDLDARQELGHDVFAYSNGQKGKPDTRNFLSHHVENKGLTFTKKENPAEFDSIMSTPDNKARLDALMQIAQHASHYMKFRGFEKTPEDLAEFVCNLIKENRNDE